MQGDLLARPSAELVVATSITPLLRPILEALNRFNDNPELVCLPVLRGGQLCGLLNRHRFMKTHMVGRFGYGLNLNYDKNIEEILDYLETAHYSSVEEMACKIHGRQPISIYDDICITRSGKIRNGRPGDQGDR